MVCILSTLSKLTSHVPSTALFILNSSINLALLVSQETCWNGLLLFKTIVFNVLSWNIAILSAWLPVLSGIPWSTGHCFRPCSIFLFIDYIGIISSGSVTHKLFADDVKLYSTIDTNLDSVLLQSSLDRLHQWCCNWQLSVNVGKRHVLHIGKTNHHCSYF